MEMVLLGERGGEEDAGGSRSRMEKSRRGQEKQWFKGTAGKAVVRA